MNFKLTSVDPLDSNIGIHILCNVLSAFTKMLTGRISPTIKSFFFLVGDHFLYSPDINV